ncbi:MAG: putative RNA-binding protein [Clostridiales bacterium]|nr:putative RNA-binding protein [Clostridiales bacterium]
MEYLIIDGYNIINAWTDIFNLRKEPLEDCRVRFLNILSNYQGYKKINVIVVFDAHLVKGSQEKHEAFDNITVVFTKENETADNYIERFVHKMASSNKVQVATSDYLEQTIILSNGGIRMTSRELKDEVFYVSQNSKGKMQSLPKKANTIMEHVSPELLEVLEKIRRGGN